MDTLRAQHAAFAGGRFPTLLYANRQNAQGGRRDRPLHRHEDLCELLICYHGGGIYRVDDETYEIHAGDLIYYNAGSRHEVRSAAETEIGTYCLGFTDLRLPGLPANHLVRPGESFVRPAGQKEAFLLSLADEIVSSFGLSAGKTLSPAKASECETAPGTCRGRASGNGIPSPAKKPSAMPAPDSMSPSAGPAAILRVQMMATVFLLTACGLPSTGTRSIPVRSSEIARAAKDYIDQRFTQNLDIAGIAAHVHCSSSSLAHAFKEYTGHAPLQYIRRCRIGQAQTLLISSDYSAAYISSLVGFESPEYFHRVFRKIVGETPLQYRAKYLADLRGSRRQL